MLDVTGEGWSRVRVCVCVCVCVCDISVTLSLIRTSGIASESQLQQNPASHLMNETIDTRVWHTIWHIICKKRCETAGRRGR